MSLEHQHLTSTDLSEILDSVEVQKIGRGTSSLRHGGTVSYNPDRTARVMRRSATAKKGDQAAEIIERRMQQNSKMQAVIGKLKEIPAHDTELLKAVRNRLTTYKTALKLFELGRVDEGRDLLEQLFLNLRIAYQKGYIDDSSFYIFKERKDIIRALLNGQEGTLWDQMIYEKAIDHDSN